MAGNKIGGQKAKQTMLERYGKDFYKTTGSLGGKAKVPKGFAIRRDIASSAGKKGGSISRRNKND